MREISIGRSLITLTSATAPLSSTPASRIVAVNAAGSAAGGKSVEVMRAPSLQGCSLIHTSMDIANRYLIGARGSTVSPASIR
ncbi:hypothetical protein S58_71040 [Bradyrhizobium oligotrophicum S58]|uniref:Uncharacterized protein n=1 Tax=Bradyrhizobium oligotrophicum S58 TaxID=1245469 RepID=M4ZH32_9BRAD|nr:hypothetical protein S58_71040 [Bradyrhizobium oligotrophicum S58]